MNYKELYLDGAKRQISDVSGIKKQSVELKSRPIESLKENWILVLGFIVVVMALMLISFNPTTFLICVIFIVGSIGLFILGNKYSVICNKDCITIKQHIQSYNIPYKSVKNVFLERSARIFFKRSYVLIIRCEDQMNFLREFELPVTCCKIEEVEAFINNFKIAGQSDPATINYNKRRSLKRIVNTAFTIVCVAIIVWFCFANGIIKMP